jgi:hypothetical protein
MSAHPVPGAGACSGGRREPGFRYLKARTGAEIRAGLAAGRRSPGSRCQTARPQGPKSKIHDISPRSPRVGCFRVCFQRSAAFASSMAIFVATMRTNESSGDRPCSKLRETNSLAVALTRSSFVSPHPRPVCVGWDATWSPLCEDEPTLIRRARPSRGRYIAPSPCAAMVRTSETRRFMGIRPTKV